jgi:pantetheine-phosphate adenylyltransferase
VVVRAKTHIETVRGREAIVVDELPYQVNKKTLQERISELVREKRIEGIAHMQDESDRDGMRLVIECRKDATPDVVLNQLHRFTAMQSSFGVNMLALNRGRPEQLGLRALLDLFLEFREEVVVRRTRFELNKARDRGHVLVGLAIAVVNIDEVIAIIRSSADPGEARERLMAPDWPVGDMDPLIRLIEDPRTRTIEDADGLRVRLTDEQARAILALTLARLTGLGRDEIFDEAQALSATIRRLLEILGDRALVLGIMRQELVEVREQFAVSRRSVFVEGDADLEDEDLIAREEMVVTVTHGGYVKRTPLATYRTQRRGGRGRSAMATKDEDAVTRVFSASTHAPVLFFSSEGKVYTLKVWRIPIGLPNTRGRSFNNLLPLEAGETITSILPLPEDPSFWDRTDVMFATQSGGVRRNKLSDFQRINRAGKIAMKLDEGDHIVGVALCTEEQDVLLTTALGRSIRFAVDDVRVFAGRESTGVRGIRLAEGDRVISMAILRRVAASPAERLAYLSHASAMRAAAGEPLEEEPTADTEEIAEIADAEEGGAAAELRRRNGRGQRLAGAHRRAGRRGRVHPDAYRRGLRQTHLLLRLPPLTPGRAGDRRLQHGAPRRPPGGLLPGGGQRRRAPGDGRRPADPGAGGQHPHRQPQHPGRHHPAHGGRRARGLCGTRGRARRAGRRGRSRERGRGRRTQRRGLTVAERIGLYPGAFDPVTLGHLDIIKRAVKIVDRLVIGVAIANSKAPLFTLEERCTMLSAEAERLADGTEIVVRPFESLLMHFAEEVGAQIIVRGLRAVADFEYEFQMTAMNQQLNREVETVFFMADPAHQAIASRLVKRSRCLAGTSTVSSRRRSRCD